MSTTAPKGLSIAKLSVHPRLSEETLCYTCDVLWNGRTIGAASNRGHGGMTLVQFTGPDADREAALASVEGRTWPAGTMTDAAGNPMPMSFEDVVDQMAYDKADRIRIAASIKRRLAKNTVYAVGDKVWRRCQPYTPAVGAEIRAKEPDAVIYNEMALDAAVEVELAIAKRAAAAEASTLAERLRRHHAQHSGTREPHDN